jgi:hypothetical protein
LVELYQEGRLKLDELVTKRYPLEEINEAVAAVKRGEALRNVIVVLATGDWWLVAGCRSVVAGFRSAWKLRVSPSNFLANTVLPAPIKVIFGIASNQPYRCLRKSLSQTAWEIAGAV